MSIEAAAKQKLIKKYATTKNDTGSSEVQVAILTGRIQSLTEHMKLNKKDLSCRRGLLAMVANRRSLLNYLKRIDSKRYEGLIESLGIRK